MKSGMWFESAEDFCIWRDRRASEEWGAGIPELSKHFETLAIPYVVRLQILTVGTRKKAGFTLVVSKDNLEAITRWVPSFQKQIDKVHAATD